LPALPNPSADARYTLHLIWTNNDENFKIQQYMDQ